MSTVQNVKPPFQKVPLWKLRLARWLPAIYRKSPWIILAAIIILMLFVMVRWDDFESMKPTQETNNAYVHFDTIVVESKVSGYVRQVAFSDFEAVDAGGILVTLVDDDFRMAVLQAEAKREHAAATLANLELEENLQQANVEQARAAALNTAAKLDLAQREYNRVSRLVKQGAVARQEFDTAETALQSAQANHKESEALVLVQQRKLDLLIGDRPLREADLKAVDAALETAKIDLAHTRIIAPAAGHAGSCKVRVGELVKVGMQVVTLVPDAAPYVVANYKETQLTNIRVGQTVELAADTFPGPKLKGRVSGISPATGATYSLLPKDNSSGNFTKVIQRIPVRIEIESGQPLAQHLRAGMSLTVWIDTRK